MWTWRSSTLGAVPLLLRFRLRKLLRRDILNERRLRARRVYLKPPLCFFFSNQLLEPEWKKKEFFPNVLYCPHYEPCFSVCSGDAADAARAGVVIVERGCTLARRRHEGGGWVRN